MLIDVHVDALGVRTCFLLLIQVLSLGASTPFTAVFSRGVDAEPQTWIVKNSNKFVDSARPPLVIGTTTKRLTGSSVKLQ
jgi:hypothetical protein